MSVTLHAPHSNTLMYGCDDHDDRGLGTQRHFVFGDNVHETNSQNASQRRRYASSRPWPDRHDACTRCVCTSRHDDGQSMRCKKSVRCEESSLCCEKPMCCKEPLRCQSVRCQSQVSSSSPSSPCIKESGGSIASPRFCFRSRSDAPF